MKKKLALTLILSMALGLTACGSAQGESTGQDNQASSAAQSAGQEEASGQAGETTEVVWWTYFGDQNIEFLQNVIDDFNESQDEYHVTIEYQGSQAEMNAKIQSTTKEDLPALFSGAVENVAMYAGADYCEPLQTYIDQDEEGWPELDSTWDAIRIAYCDNEGNQVGYPIGYSYPGIYYNADMLEEAGIDPSQIQSFDDLYSACQELVNGGLYDLRHRLPSGRVLL